MMQNPTKKSSIHHFRNVTIINQTFLVAPYLSCSSATWRQNDLGAIVNTSSRRHAKIVEDDDLA